MEAPQASTEDKGGWTPGAQAVVLFYVDDLPVADIAEVMECSVNTVKVHLHRARQGLARELELDEDPS